MSEKKTENEAQDPKTGASLSGVGSTAGSILINLMNSPLVVISGGPHIIGGGGVIRDIYKVIITGPKKLLMPLLEIGTRREISDESNDSISGPSAGCRG